MEQGFSQAYPNFPVRHRQVYEHEAMALFAETIAIQSDEIDIFELPIGMASQSAIEKGYYVPLTQSQIIRETTDGYWPFFRQTVIHQGEIAAVLGKTEQYTLGYSRYALDRLGLTASDMPTGFSELMDFLLAWDERTGELSQREGITPFGIENSQLKAELFACLLDQYFLLMQQDPACRYAVRSRAGKAFGSAVGGVRGNPRKWRKYPNKRAVCTLRTLSGQ